MTKLEAPVERAPHIPLVGGLDDYGRQGVVRCVAVHHIVRLALVLVHGLIPERVKLVAEKLCFLGRPLTEHCEPAVVACACRIAYCV